MFDENKHTHPQNNDEGPRHIHRGIKRSEPDEVEVDSADFFSPEPPRPKAPPKPSPTPPSEPPKPPVPPRKQWEPLHPSEPAPADDDYPEGNPFAPDGADGEPTRRIPPLDDLKFGKNY